MIIPKFENETQEANWWFEHQDLLSEEFQKAAAEGRLGIGTVKRRVAEAEARQQAESSVQLDEEDVKKAHEAAERKGISYQSYVKMLIHEALEKEPAA